MVYISYYCYNLLQLAYLRGKEDFMAEHQVNVRLTDEEYQSLLERVAYLQSQRPGSKVSKSDAIRQALSISYTRKRTDTTE